MGDPASFPLRRPRLRDGPNRMVEPDDASGRQSHLSPNADLESAPAQEMPRRRDLLGGRRRQDNRPRLRLHRHPRACPTRDARATLTTYKALGFTHGTAPADAFAQPLFAHPADETLGDRPATIGSAHWMAIPRSSTLTVTPATKEGLR